MKTLDYVVAPLDFEGLKHEKNIIELDIDNIQGVYFLVDGEEIVYVGQSNNIYYRIHSHKQDKVFDKIYYIPVKDENKLDEIETHYIVACNPKYNKTHQEMIFLNNYRQDHKLTRSEKMIIKNEPPTMALAYLGLDRRFKNE